MAKEKKPGKRPLEQYDHKGKQRVNNPPVGLAMLPGLCFCPCLTPWF
jgi:hypothetical protein